VGEVFSFSEWREGVDTWERTSDRFDEPSCNDFKPGW